MAFEPGDWKIGIATAGLLLSSERKRVLGSAKLDARDVAQARHLAVRAGFDDDVAEFFFAREAALRVDRKLEVEVGQRRRCADDAGGGLHVLRRGSH